ncbi:MAG: ATP-binding protein [Campylobacterota bacterium]|nr:ATP-binding protein [Campylobacterota bacterium]
MESLLNDYYLQSLHVSKFIPRKVIIDENSLQLIGVTQSGKTLLLKQYLLTCKKNSYLYIDCRDRRLDINKLNASLEDFCHVNKIQILVLDNYIEAIKLPTIAQLIISSEKIIKDTGLEPLLINPLDYEEFLAYEPKYDSTALNHFLQLGGYPVMHSIPSESRHLYLQEQLSSRLNDIEFDILSFIAKNAALKLSAFAIYERLKSERRISKDKLYQNLDSLLAKRYIYQLEKYEHTRAVKKLYLCDIAIKNSLTIQKYFVRLFENLIFLEMTKRDFKLYYTEGIDFYLPEHQRIVLCMPFAVQDALFKKIESVEAFIIENNVLHVEVVTVGSEGSLHHPFVKVAMMPFSEWAIIEGEQ